MPNVKNGINPDRCFSLRYKLHGKDKEEVIGWASEGITAEKAFKTLSKIVNERARVTPDIAQRLARAFNTSWTLWLGLQSAVDQWEVENTPGAWEKITPLPGLAFPLSQTEAARV